MNIDISQIGYRWKGLYSEFLTYSDNDVVYQNGGAYVVRNGVLEAFALGQQEATATGHLLTGGVSVGGFGNMALHSNGAGGVEFRFQDTRNGTLATGLADCYRPGQYRQSRHSMAAFMHDGSMRSWGAADDGQGGAGDAGDISRTSPTRVAFPPFTPRVVKMLIVWDVWYYVDAEGGLWHSGANVQNIAGTGSQNNIPTKINGYGDIASSTKIVDIVGAMDWYDIRQAFAIDDQGRVYGIGSNNNNSQGITGTSPTPRIIPFTIDTPIAKVFCGGGTYGVSAFISREGQMWTAGEDNMSHGPIEYPHQLFHPWGFDKAVKEVTYSESDGHWVAGNQYYRGGTILLENGDLHAYGNNGAQVSHGFGIDYNASIWYNNYADYPPKILSGVAEAVLITGGYERMLARMTDGTVQHTGHDSNGGFGGGGGDRTTWATIGGSALTNVARMKAFGARYGGTAFALRTDGTMVGWGGNSRGAHGVGDNSNKIPEGGDVLLNKTIVDFQVTGNVYDATSDCTLHCLTSDGQVYSCGYGGYGINGDDDSEDTYVPRQIIF